MNRGMMDFIKGNYRWGMGLVMLVVLAFGWHYPLLGFMVPVVMITGPIGAVLYKGRFACGNLCPRGSFFDTWFRFFSGRRAFPELFAKPWFRWSVVAVLFAVMGIQVVPGITSIDHWGTVFWRVCLITTLAGIVLGSRYRERAWCAVCPMGTIQAAIGYGGGAILSAPECTGCGVCEKSCPMGHEIVRFVGNDGQPNSDCLQCDTCIAACPRSNLARKRTC